MKGFRNAFWLLGLIMGLLAILIHLFASTVSVEDWYGHGIYPVVRFVVDHTVSLTILPFLYLLALLILYGGYRQVKTLLRSDITRKKRWVLFLKHLFSFVGWVVFLFYFLWGFNYDRIQLGERLNWENQNWEEDDFVEEARGQVQVLSQLRSSVDDWNQNLLRENYQLLEITIRKKAVSLASELGYIDKAGVRCRQLVPGGILLRFGTAGFYNPFTGECNIDKGLHFLQKPFIMAHEFFHGMGVTGEGDCNFLAYILCHQSEHPYIRYSGELAYWRYLRGGVYRHDQDLYKNLVENLDDAVRQDLIDISEKMDEYPDIAPRIRDQLYNAYLRSNKIPEGMANYGNIVRLVMQWRREGYRL